MTDSWRDAVIKSTFVGLGRGYRTVSIFFEFTDGSGRVGFGGRYLQGKIEHVVFEIMNVFEVERWEDLPGIPCVVHLDDGQTADMFGPRDGDKIIVGCDRDGVRVGERARVRN